MTEERGLWALLDRDFASLDQLNEFFNVWARQVTVEPEDAWDEVEQVRALAIERFKKRAAAAEAAASQPMPQPKPVPAPLPPDATDDEKAARMYGPSPTELIRPRRMPRSKRRPQP